MFQIEELYHEIEDRDKVLTKARETAHKAQLQKYQASEIRHSIGCVPGPIHQSRCMHQPMAVCHVIHCAVGHGSAMSYEGIR